MRVIRSLALLFAITSSSASAVNIRSIVYNAQTHELRAEIEYHGPAEQQFRIVINSFRTPHTRVFRDPYREEPVWELRGEILESAEEGRIAKKESKKKLRKRQGKKKHVLPLLVREVVFTVAPQTQPVYFPVLEHHHAGHGDFEEWAGEWPEWTRVIEAVEVHNEEVENIAEGAALRVLPTPMQRVLQQVFLPGAAEGCSQRW